MGLKGTESPVQSGRFCMTVELRKEMEKWTGWIPQLEAQSVKCLSRKHGDLILIPQTHVNNPGVLT